jgi:Flp pilus assembly protein TadG
MLRNLHSVIRRGAMQIRRFRAAQQGATAVEFALVAPAFLALLFAVIQVTLFLFAQQTLQNAAVQAGRQFMTGSAQSSNMTQAGFANVVCPLVSALLTCSKLQINVANYSSFSAASTAAPAMYDSHGNLQTSGTFDYGSQGTIMVVQIVYPWPVFGIPIGSVLPNSGYGTTELMGVTAFRVEPY